MTKHPCKRIHIDTIKKLFYARKKEMRIRINYAIQNVLSSSKEHPIKYGTKFHLKHWTHSGEWWNLNDASGQFIKFLEAVQIKYEIGNDAPRGGKEGDYIQILTKIKY